MDRNTRHATMIGNLLCGIVILGALALLAFLPTILGLHRVEIVTTVGSQTLYPNDYIVVEKQTPRAEPGTYWVSAIESDGITLKGPNTSITSRFLSRTEVKAMEKVSPLKLIHKGNPLFDETSSAFWGEPKQK